MSGLAVALTGHRPQHLNAQQSAWARVVIPQVMARLVTAYDMRVAISGMALGADTWWALAALSAGVELRAYIPFEAQAARWSAADQALWHAIRASADREVMVSDGEFSVGALHARNDAMIAAGDAVVALLRGSMSTGGTADAYRKTIAAGKPVLHLDPDACTVTWAEGRRPLP